MINKVNEIVNNKVQRLINSLENYLMYVPKYRIENIYICFPAELSILSFLRAAGIKYNVGENSITVNINAL